MDATDCRRLDNGLRRCRPALPKFAVHDAFVAAAHERGVAEEQRAAACRTRASQAADARSAGSFGASSRRKRMSIRARGAKERKWPAGTGRGRRRGSRRRGAQTKRGDAFTADGAFAMVDDDEGMRGADVCGGARWNPWRGMQVGLLGRRIAPFGQPGVAKRSLRTRDDFPARRVGGAAVVAEAFPRRQRRRSRPSAP